jgi:hypothetical protein
MYIDGLWNAWWDSGSNTLNVTTQEVHCHDYFMFGLNNSDYSASVYAVTFWVTGPKGVIP